MLYRFLSEKEWRYTQKIWLRILFTFCHEIQLYIILLFLASLCKLISTPNFSFSRFEATTMMKTFILLGLVALAVVSIYRVTTFFIMLKYLSLGYDFFYRVTIFFIGLQFPISFSLSFYNYLYLVKIFYIV